MKKIGYIILLFAFISCKDKKEEEVTPVNNVSQITFHSEDIQSVSISPDGNTIYYTIPKARNSMGNFSIDLYSIKADGSDQKKILTYPDGQGFRPVVSPDNKQLAFSVSKNTTSGYDTEIVLGSINGTGFRTLLSGNGVGSVHGFSQDGKSLIYTSREITGNCACNTIWKISTDSLKKVMISPVGKNAAIMELAADKNRILVDTNSDAYSMDLDGQNVVQLGGLGSFLKPKSISALNGSVVLFKVVPGNNNISVLQLFVSDAAGSNLHQITYSEVNNFPISFFPAGDEILLMVNAKYASQDDSELYSIKPDGSDLRRLTTNNYEEFPIGFLEKKKKILFPSNKDGAKNLYVLDLE